MTEEESRERIERCKLDNPDLTEEVIIELLRLKDEKHSYEFEPFRFGAGDDEDSDSET